MISTSGRIVRVRTFDWKDGSHTDATWWAAIDDDANAVKAVKIAVKARADDHHVEVVGVLPPAEIERVGLKVGATKQISGSKTI